MAINFPTGQKTQPQAAYTKQQVLDRLMLWSENLKEHDARHQQLRPHADRDRERDRPATRPAQRAPRPMTEPYYQDDAVTIYHGDCREILPALTADAVVTDPPYGVAFDRKTTKRRQRESVGYMSAHDGPEYLDAVVIPVIAQLRAEVGRMVITPGIRNLWRYPEPDALGTIFYPAGAGRNDRPVWVILFRLDVSERPRLLAQRSEELYTDSSARALPGEAEALSEHDYRVHVEGNKDLDHGQWLAMSRAISLNERRRRPKHVRKAA